MEKDIGNYYMQLGFSKAQSYKRKKKSNYWTTIRLVRKLARKALEIILMMKQKVAPTSKTKWQRTQIYAKAEAGVCVSKSIRESSVRQTDRAKWRTCDSQTAQQGPGSLFVSCNALQTTHARLHRMDRCLCCSLASCTWVGSCWRPAVLRLDLYQVHDHLCYISHA